MKIRRSPRSPSSWRSSALVRIGATAASVAALALGGVVAAAPSQAGACSATGGDSDHLMWTGKGYTCAYVAASGNKSISFAATKTWTSNTAMGYSKRYTCHGQTGGVTVKYVYTDSAGTNLGSSITYTAINTSDGDRHWNAAVLWNTANNAGSVADDQFVHNCSTDKSIGVNQVYESKATLSGPTSYKSGDKVTYTINVQNNQGGPTPAGVAYLFAETTPGTMNPPTSDCAGNSTNKTTPVDVPLTGAVRLDSTGTATLTPLTLPGPVNYKFYAVYSGYPLTSAGKPGYCLAPPQPTGLTPATTNVIGVKVNANYNTNSLAQPATAAKAASAAKAAKSVPVRGDVAFPNPGLDVVNRAATAPNPVAGHCPKGRVPVQLSLASPTVPLDPDNLERIKNGAAMSTDGLPAGTEVDLQLVCRNAKAAAAVLPGISWGSVRADTFTTNRKGGSLFGGLGNDQLSVVNKKGGAWGGPGKDSATLRANGSAASGGPGNDRLVSKASGTTLLVGGPGNDKLIGAKGSTVINALDGKGGDTIVCKSSSNVVYADPGDRTKGPCTIRQP